MRFRIFKMCFQNEYNMRQTIRDEEGEITL